MNTAEIIALILIIIGAMGTIIFIPIAIRRKRWRDKVKHDYISKARIEIFNDSHRQRVILWLQSKEAEDLYIDFGGGFYDKYKAKVDKIGVELIEALTKKYTDEYKSRNTKNTKAV